MHVCVTFVEAFVSELWGVIAVQEDSPWRRVEKLKLVKKNKKKNTDNVVKGPALGN